MSQENLGKKRLSPSGESAHDPSAAKKAKINKPVERAVNPSVKEEEERRSSLPIYAHRQLIIESVAAHATTVVVGETGSGKSTQIPQFLANEKFIMRGKSVVCTQPRRVAAITIAEQVAKERRCRLGDEVGYSIRFEDKTSRSTRIKYATDGVLLREIMSDPMLSQYSVVILDEAHERSMQTDILMGLLKELQSVRKDLKLIVMSATLQVDLFRAFFQDVSVVNVPGRQFPVDILYAKVPEADFIDAALLTCLQIHEEAEPGGVLVFLPGQEDIESLQQLLTEHLPTVRATHGGVAISANPPAAIPSETISAQEGKKIVEDALLDEASNKNGKEVTIEHLHDFVLLPLYAAMAPEEQLKAFTLPRPGVRKFVLATNIAETSVTIAGIRYVVDTGYVKSRSIAAGSGVESLQVTAVSQAQALQRAGRAGREGPGVCYRLYTEAVFETLPPTSKPEIQRMNLAQVILQLKELLAPPLQSRQQLRELLQLPTTGDNNSSVNKDGVDNSVVPTEIPKAIISAASAIGKSTEVSKTGTFSFAQRFAQITDFPFLTPPSLTGLKTALQTLLALDALDLQQCLTPLGRAMSLLPLHPAFARMLLHAPHLGCTAETLTAVSLLSTEHLFVQPTHDAEKQEATKRQRQFALPEGDLPTLIHIYHSWLQSNKSKYWAQRNYLSQRALQQACAVREQLARLLQETLRIDVQQSQWPHNKDAFLTCLLVGLRMQVAVKVTAEQSVVEGGKSSVPSQVTSSGKVFSYSSNQQKNNQKNRQNIQNQQQQQQAPYRTLHGNQDVHVHPSSVLFSLAQQQQQSSLASRQQGNGSQKNSASQNLSNANAQQQQLQKGGGWPQYVVYAELLVTTKKYLRTVTVVDANLVASVLGIGASTNANDNANM